MQFTPLDESDYLPPTEETTDYTPTTGEFGFGGKTVFPTKGELYNSSDGKLHIFLNSAFSEEGRAQMFAHEGYGHAVLFIRNPDNPEKARHQTSGQTDNNTELKHRIITGMNEVHRNMRSR